MVSGVQTADWTFPSGMIAVREMRLLTNDEYLDLLRLADFQALLSRVKQVETYVNLPVPDAPDLAARTLEREFVRLVCDLASDCPDTAVCEITLATYLFAEVRRRVRARLFPEHETPEPVELLGEEELDALAHGTVSARLDPVRMAEEIRQRVEKSADGAAVMDLLVDRELLIWLGERARTLDSEFIDTWVDRHVRLTLALGVVRARLGGIRTDTLVDGLLAPPLADPWLLELARAELDRLDATLAQHFTSPEGEAVEASRHTVGTISRMMDDELTTDMKQARLVPFGPERVLGYLRGLGIENLNLRLITQTFAVEGDRDETRTRLRMSYV